VEIRESINLTNDILEGLRGPELRGL